MKKHTQFSLFIALLLCLTTTAKTFGQDVDKEMQEFAQKYQDAYNKEDHATLKTLYTADAKRIAQDTISGAEAIAAQLARQFAAADATLQITQKSTSWSDFHHTIIASGTYSVKGKDAAGKVIDFSGQFSNFMLKENGVWKISNSTLK